MVVQGIGKSIAVHHQLNFLNYFENKSYEEDHVRGMDATQWHFLTSQTRRRHSSMIVAQFNLNEPKLTSAYTLVRIQKPSTLKTNFIFLNKKK